MLSERIIQLRELADVCPDRRYVDALHECIDEIERLMNLVTANSIKDEIIVNQRREILALRNRAHGEGCRCDGCLTHE